MRILVISNFFPPYHIGGYELGCADVVAGLKTRGHEVRVLTSHHGIAEPTQSNGVYRWLRTDSLRPENAGSQHVAAIVKKELANRRAMKRVCASFRPDLVYVWNAASISTSIIFIAQTLRLPVCYFVSDSWLSRWQTDAGYSLNNRRPARLSRRIAWRPVESLLRRVSLISDDVLDLTHVQFASAYLKKDALRAGKPVTGAEVVHWGIDTTRFAFKNEGRPGCRDRLLYAGQLVPHKGVQTALQALKSLLQQPAYKSLNLTIVGGPDYGDDVQNLVSTLGLQAHVRLTGMVPRADLPRIYREHDILIFPSIWEEPFSITLLEAMSSGLAVVATSTGGSTEILSDNENAIVFRPRDAAGCAYAIRRLVDDGELCETLRHNGRRAVEQHFTLNQMLDKVERSLIYCFEQATLRRETGETRHRIDWQPKAGES